MPQAEALYVRKHCASCHGATSLVLWSGAPKRKRAHINLQRTIGPQQGGLDVPPPSEWRKKRAAGAHAERTALVQAKADVGAPAVEGTVQPHAARPYAAWVT